MEGSLLVIILIVIFAVAFSVTNGWNDAANAIATVVATRVLTPLQAVIFGGLLNTIGAFASSEVANTIGKGIADPRIVTGTTFLAAVVIAPIWVTYCTKKGLPISCSHSLMGGLIGAVIATAGISGLQSEGIKKIVFGILFSPIIGFLLGYVIMVIVAWLFRNVKPRTASLIFGKLQLVSAGAMAFAHGTGDAQKAMGIISGALVAGGFLAMGDNGKLPIPAWVRIVCAVTMGIGTAVGGWAVVRTLGTRLAHLRPHQGFSAETAGATTILVNTLTGVPISTTHSITGAVMGVGAAHGVKSVKWTVGKKIVFAWVVTFPVCIAGGAVLFLIMRYLGVH